MRRPDSETATTRAGDAVLLVHSKCVRCAMVTHGFDDLTKEPRIMRTLVRENDGNLGVYALVEESGEICVGDRVTLLDPVIRGFPNLRERAAP